MSNLWIFGDSFSSDFDIKHAHQNHIDYMKFKCVDTMIYWPTLLTEKLNYNLNNFAKGGNSNYQIFFDFCENIKSIYENDIVLVGWALIGKFIIADNNGFNNIHPYNSYHFLSIKNDTIQDIVENRKLKAWENEINYWEILMNETINNKNAKILFWSGEENKLNKAKIDLTSCPTMTSETNELVQDSHLGIDGHNKLAEIFYNKLT